MRSLRARSSSAERRCSAASASAARSAIALSLKTCNALAIAPDLDLFGITVGKLCTGTRVVDENGHAIGFRRALLRSLCRLIPFDAFSVLMSDDQTIRGWHDSLPRTYVVLRKAQAPEVTQAAA